MAIVTGPNYAGAVGKYLDFRQQQNVMKETIRSNKAREQIARDETEMKMKLLQEGGTIESGHIGERTIGTGKNIQEKGKQDLKSQIVIQTRNKRQTQGCATAEPNNGFRGNAIAYSLVISQTKQM